jgi:hypothetical protein
MNAIETAQHLASCLDEDDVPYAIGGALALGVWGASRATNDVDISIFVERDRWPTMFDALERAGVMIDRNEATRDFTRIGFYKGRLGRRAVDIFVSDHPQAHEMLHRRQLVGGAYFISAEDLIVHKLIFGRPKDELDLQRLVAARSTLDLAYVRGWLIKMLPAGDRRFAILDDLERRFATGNPERS